MYASSTLTTSSEAPAAASDCTRTLVSEKPREYETAVCEMIKRYVAQTAGRAFVLFTSYQMMKSCENWTYIQNMMKPDINLPRS